MKEKVFLIRSSGESDPELSAKLSAFLDSSGLLDFIEANDIIALKTHFGESTKSGYVRPVFIKAVGDLVKGRGGKPFLTETSTLYRGNRTNALDHIMTAVRHGFGSENSSMPIIMADGLYGDEEVEVPIPGKIHTSVKIAALFSRVQGAVIVSHFTGHLAAGFGAALKNMGMGCSSRKGKLLQHSTAKPRVKQKLCTRCGVCVKWCPADAIDMEEKGARIDQSRCIGCGQCLAVCRFDAVAYNWGATYEDLQKKVVEHAMGLSALLGGRALYINFLTRISKDCDCMDVYENIVPDAGILVSRDPVAIDAASLDLVEKAAGKKLSEMAYNIPCGFQLEYAKELGFGSAGYELEES
ncbi:MAG: DUF362 domain-containing protein [Spirochaetes bacterium]|jgi:hypothetical protein|nr:DUF362 domain-containing protein [Spirochaetota bacterium]